MISHDVPVRWAANAPSGALLAAALRDELPRIREETLQPGIGYPSGAGGGLDLRRIWSLQGAALLKRFDDPARYRTEVRNLRFFNAIARAHTPRLLACDDAACALLIEDPSGSNLVEITASSGALGTLMIWLRVLAALATVHARAARGTDLLRRCYAPHWPQVLAAPPANLLERLPFAAPGVSSLPALSAADRGVLASAGTWLHDHLGAALGSDRAPMLGQPGPEGIQVSHERVIFADLSKPPLGIQAMDLACTWQLPDRRELIAEGYLAVSARLGHPLDVATFWRTDACCRAAGCALQLITFASSWPAAGQVALAATLCEAAAEVPELATVGELLRRLLLG